MKISGFGLYPWHDVNQLIPTDYQQISHMIKQSDSMLIARGQGLSYGDSALSDTVISSKYLNHLLAYDQEQGILRCQSGVTLKQILDVIIPRGYFLPVVPGTQYISIGGAIASDIHGKNHHQEGSFTNHVLSITLLMASGEIISCSPTLHANLFYASCGGMGLTGIILEAAIKLKPIESAWIHQHSSTSKNLEDTLEQLKLCKDNYSVSWLDLTRLPQIKAINLSANHGLNKQFILKKNKPISIPCYLPSFSLHTYSIKLFNSLYYWINKRKEQSYVPYYQFFFALDGINAWNRCYGKAGLLQYQFLLPYSSALRGIKEIVTTLKKSNITCNLAVLKNFGPANRNLLSFPQPGFTLAMDFKRKSQTLALFKRFDNIVLEHGGRLYMAKDAVMTAEMMQQCYPRLNEFLKIRTDNEANTKFNSLQSQRFGI